MPSLQGSRSRVEPPRRSPQGAGDLVTRVGGVQRRCPGLLLELAKVALHLGLTRIGGKHPRNNDRLRTIEVRATAERVAHNAGGIPLGVEDGCDAINDDRVFNGTTDEGHLLSKRLWAI